MRKNYHRVGFSETQKVELWERWRKGESLSAIGREFGKPSSCIFSHIRPTGGITPVPRRQSRLALTLADREEISRGLVSGLSMRAIARTLGRATSSISREINRKGGHRRYRAAAADKRAWKQTLRPKACKLAQNARLRQVVVVKLQRHWSPEQIAGWLKRHHPCSEAMHVSHGRLIEAFMYRPAGS